MGKQQQQTGGEIPEVEVPIPPNPKTSPPTTGAYHLSLKYTNEKKNHEYQEIGGNFHTLCSCPMVVVKQGLVYSDGKTKSPPGPSLSGLEMALT